MWRGAHVAVRTHHSPPVAPARIRGSSRRVISATGAALSLGREVGDKIVIAGAPNHLADVALQQGHYERGRSLSRESLALCRELGNRRGIGQCLWFLGQVAYNLDEADAESILEEILQINRELGDRQGIAHSLMFLGNIARFAGQYKRARELHEEATAILVEDALEARSLGEFPRMGYLVMIDGEPQLAREIFTAALTIYQQRGHKEKVALSLAGLVGVTALTSYGGPAALRAARLVGVAATLYRSMNQVEEKVVQVDLQRALAAARAQLKAEEWAAAFAEGQAMATEDAIEYALAPLDQLMK